MDEVFFWPDLDLSLTVFIYSFRFFVDEDEDIMNDKMDKTEIKYPVEKAKGRSTKYTKL